MKTFLQLFQESAKTETVDETTINESTATLIKMSSDLRKQANAFLKEVSNESKKNPNIKDKPYLVIGRLVAGDLIGALDEIDSKLHML